MRKNVYVDINKETYNNVANDLKIRHTKSGTNEPTAEDYYNKIFKYLKQPKDLKKIKYLELGPGDGFILKYFANQGLDTYAIENSEEMLNLSKENSPYTQFIENNILNVNLKDNTYDIIFAGSFLHLFPNGDVDTVMKKVYNWLKKDGIFFAYTTQHEIDEEGYFSKTKGIYPNENKRFRHKYTKESFEKIFLDNNFIILEHYQISEPEHNKIWQFLLAKK